MIIPDHEESSLVPGSYLHLLHLCHPEAMVGLVQRGLIASARAIAMGCLSRQVMNKAEKLVGSWRSYLGFLEDD